MTNAKKAKYIAGAGKVSLALLDWEFMTDAIPNAKTRLRIVGFLVTTLIPGIVGCMAAMDFNEAMESIFTPPFCRAIAKVPKPLYLEVLKQRDSHRATESPKDIVKSLLNKLKNKRGEERK